MATDTPPAPTPVPAAAPHEAPDEPRADAPDVRARRQDLARRHLWMHFTAMGDYTDTAEVPVIVRGEGAYVWDEHGRRYLDGLSGLFCSNAGHSRPEIADAVSAQMRELEYGTLWSYAHPTAIELAARVAALAPGDLNRVFFTSGGAEAVESAIKVARAWHRAHGRGQRTKIVSRQIAYHGTTMGALTATGLTGLKTPFEPTMPGGAHAPHTGDYRWPADRDPLWAAEQLRERIEFEGPDTVAAVILEPVQNAGGCLVPQDGYWQRVREICDEHGILLISDEVICSWGRLGTWFGAERFGYRPDIITTAKGLTSAHVPMGAMIASDRVAEPFMAPGEMFLHGYTFAGHPAAAAAAMANLDVFEDEDLCGHVRRKEGELRGVLEELYDLPIVGQVRGAGFFQAVELVKDRETKEGFSAEEADRLLRGVLDEELFAHGLICRADDRGEPVVQLAPPLTCDTTEFRIIGDALRAGLERACEEMGLS